MPKVGALNPKLTWRPNLLYAAIVVCQIASVWFFRYFPSHDGPAHLATSRMLLDFIRSPQVRDHYVFLASPFPNWTAEVLLTGLMTIFQPVVAEKLLISAYFLLMAVCAWSALSAFSPSAAMFAFLLLPFSDTYFVREGFYSFALAIPLFLIAVVYWIKCRSDLTGRSVLILAAIGKLLWFSHVLPVGILYLVIAVVTLGDLVALRGADISRRALSIEALKRNSARTVLALSPTLFLLIIYLKPEMNKVLALVGVGRLGTIAVIISGSLGILAGAWILLACYDPAVRALANWSDSRLRRTGWIAGGLIAAAAIAAVILHKSPVLIGRRLTLLLRMQSLVSYDDREFFASQIIAALLAGMIIYTILTRKRPKIPSTVPGSFIVTAMLCVLLLAVTPDTIGGGGFVSIRLSFFAALMAVFWLASFEWGARARFVVRACAAAAAMWILAWHVIDTADLNPLISEYVSGERLLAPQSTFVTLILRYLPPHSRIPVFDHAGGYIGAETGAVFLNNYQIGTRGFPFAAVKGYPDLPDYVLTWRDPQPVLEGGMTSVEFHGAEYLRIFSSPPGGLMKMFKRVDGKLPR